MLKRAVYWSAVAMLLASVAHGQAALGGIGPRVGFSVDPDQILFGGQATIGEIVPNLTFDPSLEFGFGDDVTLVSLNFDLHYHFAIEGATWRPYAGAGVGVHFVEFDGEPFQDDSSTEVGGAFILGAGVPTSAGNRFFSEIKFGLGDVPDFKLVVGWNFKI